MSLIQQAFWSFYAKVYDAIWDSPLTRSVNALLDVSQPGSRVVDLGVGTGLSCERLTKSGCETIGVDNSPTMLSIALDKGRCTRVVVADASASTLPDRSADLVMISNLLQLHPDPAAVLAEAGRLARPGGRILCVWPCDGATLTTAARADLQAGRSPVGALIAAILRLVIGVLGGFVGARQWSGGSVAEQVRVWAASHGWELSRSGVACDIEEWMEFAVPFL